MAKTKLAPSSTDAAVRAYNRIVDEYKAESDRAAAILGASHLDVMLEWVMRAYLVDGKATNDLFDSNGPLSTFSGRIKTAFALGLLQASALHDFEIVRKIRNRFAHSTEHASFEKAPICDWCRSFAQADWPGHPGGSFKLRVPRDQFLHTVAGLSAWADWILEDIKAGRVKKCTPPPESDRFDV